MVINVIGICFAKLSLISNYVHQGCSIICTHVGTVSTNLRTMPALTARTAILE